MVDRRVHEDGHTTIGRKGQEFGMQDDREIITLEPGRRGKPCIAMFPEISASETRRTHR
jgi:hypothetical protein